MKKLCSIAQYAEIKSAILLYVQKLTADSQLLKLNIPFFMVYHQIDETLL
ncbi:MAG: hypothetical protein J6V54_08515 [Bacteroidales bacterium]|nr:hypothetical protein [Bacteroidales bacterium]